MSEGKSLRIGMVVHAYYLRDARVIRYAETATKAGHHVDVICLKDPNESDFEQVNQVNIHRVQFERKRGGKFWYIFEYVWAFVLFFFKLTSLEFKQHYDVIHVHNMPDFLIFTGIIPRLRGSKLLLDLHDPMPELFISKYNLSEGNLLKLLILQERISLGYSQYLITVDQSFKDIFIERGIKGDKISLVRNMPDERFSKYIEIDKTESRPPAGDKFVFVYTGTVAERYQLDKVIEAVGIAHKQVPHIALKIVGKLDKEGGYSQILNQAIEKFQLHDVVEILAPIPLNDVPDLLRQAQAGIDPSWHDPYTDYVLPLKVLEYAAVGLPCLVSHRPTIARYFTDEQLVYFDADSVDDLAEKMIYMAENSDKLAETAEKARKVFDTYNWDNEAATYLQLLQTMTS